jgi:predicted O-methyltransferase YrrM
MSDRSQAMQERVRRQLLANDGYRFTKAILEGRSYFGRRMAAAQGLPGRHAFMTALIGTLASSRTSVDILEVGSWAGGSAITWAKALERFGVQGRVHCVDHWRPDFDAAANTAPVYREMSAASCGGISALFRHNVRAAGVSARIVALEGDVRAVLPALAPRGFDVVFVDASHLYGDVRADLQDALRLVADDGVICGDDLELQIGDAALDARPAAERTADFVEDPLSGIGYHPGVTAAVAEIFGRVSTWFGFWAIRRVGEEWRPPDIGHLSPSAPPHLEAALSEQPVHVNVRFFEGYAIFDGDEGAFALRDGLMPDDVLALADHGRLRPDLVIAGSTREEVEQAIARHALGNAGSAHTGDEDPAAMGWVLVDEGCHGYNILSHAGRYYAIAQSLGPCDPAMMDLAALRATDHLVVADSREAAAEEAEHAAARRRERRRRGLGS